MSLKVIVLDIDGTLLNDDKVISPTTHEVLVKSLEKGYQIILCSGRPLNGVYKYGKALDFEKYGGLLIGYNGAKVYDYQNKELLYNQTMDIEKSKEALNYLKDFEVITMIDNDTYMFVDDAYKADVTIDGVTKNIIEYESRCCDFKVCEVGDQAEFLNYHLNKILVSGNPEYLVENYDKLSEPFIGIFNCAMSSPFYFEYTAINVSKQSGLEFALKQLKVDKSEVIGFGDSFNDLPLFEGVGIKVAMGNAIDQLKEVADIIAPDNNNDGVAKVLVEVLDLQ